MIMDGRFITSCFFIQDYYNYYEALCTHLKIICYMIHQLTGYQLNCVGHVIKIMVVTPVLVTFHFLTH